jgi:Putative adhesin
MNARTLRRIGALMVVLTLGYGVFTAISVLVRETTRSALEFPGGVTTLELDLDAGGATIVATATSGDRITGTRVVRRGLRKPTFAENVVGDRLKLTANCPAFGSPFCSVRYELQVPASITIVGGSAGGGISTEGIAGSQDLRSSGGGITITAATGAVHATSSGGGITIAGAAGSIDVSSSGGGISITDARSTQVKADSSGGGIQAEFTAVPDDVNVSSSGGGVTVELPAGEALYNVDANSSGGGTKVAVRTDPTSTHRVRVRSSGGGVTVRYAT